VFRRGGRLVLGGVRGATSRRRADVGGYAVLFVATFGLFKAIPSGTCRTGQQYLIGFAQLPDAHAIVPRRDAAHGRHRTEAAWRTERGGFSGLSINGFTNSSNADIVFAVSIRSRRHHAGIERRRDRRAV